MRYTVEIADAAAHLFRVTLSVPQPDVAGMTLTLPAWLPGSYMIREFAKNIVTLGATQAGRKISLQKQDKHTWRTDKLCSDAPLQIVAEIYAWDLSVRCAHLDQTHGFFNGTQMFLSVGGREHAPHEVELIRPAHADFAAWRVATTLPAARGTKPGSFGVYRAADYDELIDHPVEMGTFKLLKFHGRRRAAPGCGDGTHTFRRKASVYGPAENMRTANKLLRRRSAIQALHLLRDGGR